MKKITAVLTALLAAMSLTVSVSAAQFTASVEGKDAPALAPMTTATGEAAGALLYDASGNEVRGISETSLTITPVSQIGDASSEIGMALQSAYEQLSAADSLEEIIPDIGKVLETLSPDLSVEDLVVRDLFDISVDDEVKALLEDGHSIAFTFALGVNTDDAVLCLHNFQDDQWEVIAPERTVNNGDGTVSVTFDSLSPIAFAVKPALEGIALPPQSEKLEEELPQQSYEEISVIENQQSDLPSFSVDTLGWSLLGVMTVAVVGGFFFFSRKKKNQA